MGSDPEDFVHVSCEAFRRLAAENPRFVGVKWHAVISRTLRLKESIEYSVDIEGDSGERLITVYRRLVTFGQKTWNVAGGPAFVEVARKQDQVATAFAALIVDREGD
jgi:hypothetical protein